MRLSVPEKPRICILTPGALGSNPRVVKEAQALHEAGYDVTVVATRTLDRVDRRDDAILETAAWPSRRLDFRARGWAWRARRAAQVAQARVFSMTGQPRFAERGLNVFTGPLTAAAAAVTADLYVAHYPAALPAAASAARRHGASYAYDAEDFHLGELPDLPAHAAQRDLIRAVEGRYIAGCAYVTAASPGIADAYAEAYGIERPTVLLNVFPRAEAPAAATPAGTAEPGPSVYWFSQTVGPGRGLECAVQAIAQARSRPHLYLRGTPAAGFLDRLHRLAADAGAGDRLHILAPEAPFEMARLAAQYGVGFSGEPGHSQNNRIALVNKLFTYLLAGLPTVLSDIPAHRAFVPEAGDAVRLYRAGNAADLAAGFDLFFEQPARLAAARETAFRLGQTRFNWDLEKGRLLKKIDRIFRRNELNGIPVTC